jgi:o-succinylbenzoate---CoA ligase
MNWTNIHCDFKLNGKHFSKEELFQLAYSLIKEGEKFQYDCGTFLLDWLDQNDYIIVQTSGTTGIPKLLKINKKAMVNSAIASSFFLGLTAGNSALCCLPVQYIAGKMMWVRALVLGLHLDFVVPSSFPLLNNKNDYDFVAMVPLQAENSIGQLHQIRQLIIGGAKVSSTLVKKLQSSSCKIYETYSMTETVTHIALKPIGEEVFKVLPNVKIAIDNRACLIIDAPLLNDQKIYTNDIVELVSDNEFIWKGRIDHIINSGGIKLFPEVIEEKLTSKINNRFFIAGIPDEKLGERVAIFIEGDAFIISDLVFESLQKYEKPKSVFFIPKFIETETGKIKRKETIQIVTY